MLVAAESDPTRNLRTYRESIGRENIPLAQVTTANLPPPPPFSSRRTPSTHCRLAAVH